MRYPSIVKAVRNYQDGLWSLQENLAFSPFTGSPILNRTIDGYNNQIINNEAYNGSYYSYSIPAAAVYDAMGQKSIDPSYSNQLTAVAGSVVTYGSNPLGQTTPQNVINASVTTYKNDWVWSENILTEYGVDPEEIILVNPLGLNDLYRPYESYVFKSEVSGSNLTDEKVYSGGIFTDFVNFDFANSIQDGGWLKMNTVTNYSPNGSPLEEKNILNIFSAVKYGYNKTMPVALAQNAQWESIYFDDFEYNTEADQEQSHSGNKSHKVMGGTYRMIESLPVNPQLIDKGGLVKLWVKSSVENPEIYADINGVSTQFTKVARSMDWSLYEAKIKNWGLISPNSVNVDLSFASTSDIWIDDIRFQPLDAQMTTYVYDPTTLRLLTQFDDQHFGLYYQYNSDGKLVRKMIETERGMKTIQENQYNMPKTMRDLSSLTN